MRFILAWGQDVTNIGSSPSLGVKKMSSHAPESDSCGLVCRLCLIRYEKHMNSIFKSNSLAEKIFWVSDLKIFDGDGLPFHVCQRCQHRVDSAFEFKKMCWASDKFLRQLQSDKNKQKVIGVKEVIRNNTSTKLVNSEDLQSTQVLPSISSNSCSDVEVECEPTFINVKSEFKEEEKNVVSSKSGHVDSRQKCMNQYHASEAEQVYKDEVKQSLSMSRAIKLPENCNFPDKMISFSCGVCEKVFLKESVLKEHERTHKKKSLLCSVCGALLCSQTRLDAHIRRHQGIRPFTCHICSKSFYQRSEMTSHLRRHVGVKSHLCSVCGKLFSLKTSLVAHVKSHSDSKPFQCSACDKRFTFLGALKVHLRTHTGEKPFRCAQCSKTFSTLGNLRTHVGTHTGVRPFSCITCDKRFSQKGDLTVHVRSHMGEKPFHCRLCPSMFFSKGNLTKHVRAHDGVRPYSCSVCAKTFALKSTLNSHVRSHGGSKAFRCSVCPKSFTQPSSLSKHARIHSGEKNYKCCVCEKAFMRNDHLQRHLRIHDRVASDSRTFLPEKK